jgi:hypothetical protein
LSAIDSSSSSRYFSSYCFIFFLSSSCLIFFPIPIVFSVIAILGIRVCEKWVEVSAHQSLIQAAQIYLDVGVRFLWSCGFQTQIKILSENSGSVVTLGYEFYKYQFCCC